MQNPLLDRMYQSQIASSAPLATRLRPRSLDEYVGQEHILGKGRGLRTAIESGEVFSMILFGPPGTGKTTLALLIAQLAGARFEQISAVTGGVADVRRVIEQARQALIQGRRTILFVDEIHRFDQRQQDALLPALEEGLVTLIGATTQNPLVSCNAALISRSRIFELKPLQPEHIRTLLTRALSDRERGLGAYLPQVEPNALDHLVRMAGGDARMALNGLEMAVRMAPPTPPDGRRLVTLAVVEECLQQQAPVYDRHGDEHHHAASALIKSIRGSDPQAAIYWLARMLHAGEDPRFIARRLVIASAEDIGLADPQALLVAQAAAQAAALIGMPEARIPLSEATLYLALAPKSNSAYLAIDQALDYVASHRNPPVPEHLRSAGYGADRQFGWQQDYRYPHDDPRGWVPQQYLPEGVAERFYTPKPHGREAQLFTRYVERKRPSSEAKRTES